MTGPANGQHDRPRRPPGGSATKLAPAVNPASNIPADASPSAANPAIKAHDQVSAAGTVRHQDPDLVLTRRA